MAGGKNFPDEDLPGDYFAGQKHITREPDAYPDLDQMLNALRQGGGVRMGSGIVVTPGTSVAVVFTEPFLAGATVRVVATAQGQNVNVYPTAITVNGCTLNTAVLGVDCVVAYTAFAE